MERRNKPKETTPISELVSPRVLKDLDKMYKNRQKENLNHTKKRRCTDAWTRLKLKLSEQVHPKAEVVKEFKNEKDHGVEDYDVNFQNMHYI